MGCNICTTRDKRRTRNYGASYCYSRTACLLKRTTCWRITPHSFEFSLTADGSSVCRKSETKMLLTEADNSVSPTHADRFYFCTDMDFSVTVAETGPLGIKPKAFIEGFVNVLQRPRYAAGYVLHMHIYVYRTCLNTPRSRGNARLSQLQTLNSHYGGPGSI